MTDIAIERDQDRADEDTTPSIDEGNAIVRELLAAGEQLSRRELVNRYGRSERWWGYRKEAVDRDAANEKLAVTTADRHGGMPTESPDPEPSVASDAVASLPTPDGKDDGAAASDSLAAASRKRAVTTADRHDGTEAARTSALRQTGSGAAAASAPTTAIPVRWPDLIERQSYSEATNMPNRASIAPEGPVEHLSGPSGHLGDPSEGQGRTAGLQRWSPIAPNGDATPQVSRTGGMPPAAGQTVTAMPPEESRPESVAATDNGMPPSEERHAAVTAERHDGNQAASDALPGGTAPAAALAAEVAVTTAQRQDGTTVDPATPDTAPDGKAEVAAMRPPVAVTTADRHDGTETVTKAAQPGMPLMELVDSDEIRRAAVLQYAFYGTAALFALVGQVWAGVEIIFDGTSVPMGLRILIVTPALAVIELAGVATSHQADLRRRLGEQAYGYRVLSLMAALVAAGFNLAGHWGEWWPAIGFTGLSVFAYCSWLMQSGARRRDTLRAAGQMARTAPVYGVLQWIREPRLTRRARTLAVECGYGVHESLRVAREEVRTLARRKAIAAAIERRIRELHKNDEVGATIAATTYDLDRLADEVKERLDYQTAADYIAADLVLELRPESR